MRGRQSVRAFAKINLTLRVLGARPDGYHELRTVVQTLALHDTLTFEATAGPLRLTCDDPACPSDGSNLVWRAAECVWRAAGRRGEPRDVSIRLRKRIPMRAGLGGGSSDAAAALRALAAWWRVSLTERELRDLGAALGADVPFLLRGGIALGVGRGDVLFSLPALPTCHVVIVMPSFGVNTRDAYRWWDERNRRPASPPKNPRRRTVPGDDCMAAWVPPGELTNDLQAPVVAHHPSVGRLVRALEHEGARYAAMSGSGAAVFGLFAGRRAAVAAAERLTGRGRRVILTRTRAEAGAGLLGPLR